MSEQTHNIGNEKAREVEKILREMTDYSTFDKTASLIKNAGYKLLAVFLIFWQVIPSNGVFSGRLVPLITYSSLLLALMLYMIYRAIIGIQTDKRTLSEDLVKDKMKNGGDFETTGLRILYTIQSNRNTMLGPLFVWFFLDNQPRNNNQRGQSAKLKTLFIGVSGIILTEQFLTLVEIPADTAPFAVALLGGVIAVLFSKTV